MAFTIPTLRLHNRILLALVLGALFGAFFNVSMYELSVTSADSGVRRTTVIERWREVRFLRAGGEGALAEFGSGDQLRILSFVRGLREEERRGLSLQVTLADGSERTFRDVESVEKVKTIALHLRPVGTLFIRLLMLVAVPLVFCSLLVGAASLGDFRKLGRIGGRTVLLYLTTTAAAITIGLLLANLIGPGLRLDEEARRQLMAEFGGGMEESVRQGRDFDVVDMLLRIVATNPFRAMADGEMLQIIFFALLAGMSLTLIAPRKAEPVIGFFDGFSDVMIRMVDLIMVIAPFGVFALIAATVGEFGFSILGTLVWYAGTLLLGLAFHMVVTLAGLVRVLGGMHPARFFRGIKEEMLIAFSSSSSAAALPVNMESCQKNLGVPRRITSFVLPLGATINMDGTSMYQAVAVVFIAQVYGAQLDLSGQLTILLTALLASIGTAPVPGVGIIMLLIVLRSVNVPEEGIALILGVDRFLDMCRTVVNVTGDAVVSVIIARGEGVLGQAEAV